MLPSVWESGTASVVLPPGAWTPRGRIRTAMPTLPDSPIPSGTAANLLLVSTADTDLLAASQARAGWKVANPARIDPDSISALLDGIQVVVVRLLGGRRAWEEGLAAVLATGIPTVVVSGEAAPDAEL